MYSVNYRIYYSLLKICLVWQFVYGLCHQILEKREKGFAIDNKDVEKAVYESMKADYESGYTLRIRGISRIYEKINNSQKQVLKEAIDEIESVCEKHEINITEAAYRWLAYHSMLNPRRGDGIIIGASSSEQLVQNISYVNRGVLPDDIVKAIEGAWVASKVDAPEYFTFYKPMQTSNRRDVDDR